MDRHESFLRYRSFRYLKLSLLGLAIAIALYMAPLHPTERANGGTPFGYTLGGVCTALILWLTWIGVRKRRHPMSGTRFKGWLSAHVYLGSALLFLVPLHSGFQFGWNVHTLAYALMVLVILSGAFGVYLYASLPHQITENRPGRKLEQLFGELGALDAECEALAKELPDAIAHATAAAVAERPGGRGLVSQLAGPPKYSPTVGALELVRAEGRRLAEERQRDATALAEVLARKLLLLGQVRRDLRYQARLRSWLFLHVPITFGLLVAVAIHIFVVFYYDWPL